MLLIGSGALRAHSIEGRDPADWDIICSQAEWRAWYREHRDQVTHCVPVSSDKNRVVLKGVPLPIEFELAWQGATSEALLQRPIARRIVNVPGIGPLSVATPSECLMLKLSHRYKKNSVHFRKTMDDIRWLRDWGVELGTFEQELLPLREKETYTNKAPSLKRGKADFFAGDGVTYIYDHDSIHVAVKHLERPAYTYFKDDEAEVFCSKAKFAAAPEMVRLYSVLEEAYVLAIERSQVHHRGRVMPRRSFDIAMQMICTCTTSGWFREWAWENYHAVVALYDDGYVNRFWSAVERGEVAMHQPVAEAA